MVKVMITQADIERRKEYSREARVSFEVNGLYLDPKGQKKINDIAKLV